MIKKKTLKLRKAIIGAIILLFLFITAVFITQYVAYQKVRDRLDAAYSSASQQPTTLYRLFSIHSEADNLFRTYTIDFDKEVYDAYTAKLDTLLIIVDSLSSIPEAATALKNSSADILRQDQLSTEFADLKHTMENLVFIASDSLPKFLESLQQNKVAAKKPNVRSISSKLVNNDSLSNLSADTVIRKKRKLLNRIFNSKDDTLVTKVYQKNISKNEIDVIEKEVERVIAAEKMESIQDLSTLQGSFLKLRDKEKELISNNYYLLNKFREGVEKIRKIGEEILRKAEYEDLSVAKKTAEMLTTQLIILLVLMLFMIVFILNYHRIAARYERSLEIERDYAKRLADENTDILANVSHEIRTPINSMSHLVDIIKKGNTDVEAVNFSVDMVAREIKAVENIVSDILTLSKLKFGPMDTQQEHFHPYELLNEQTVAHQYSADKAGLELKADIQVDTELEIVGSPFSVRQIVSNFLSNAIKYTAEGSVELKAWVEDTPTGKLFYVRVADTGEGIPKELHAQVFRRYYTVNKSSHPQGFGLGLYISKLLAEQIGGTITLESQKGEGAIFQLIFPAKQDGLLVKDVPKYDVSDLPKDIRLVFIDDNQINIMYLKNFFAGFEEVYFFDDEQVALEFIENNAVDAIVTDMLMPKMTGRDLLEHVRSSKINRDTKVFVLTSFDLNRGKLTKEGSKYDFDGALEKPMDISKLVQLLLPKS